MQIINLITNARILALQDAKERRERLPDDTEENGERIIELQNQIEALVESLKMDYNDKN